MDSSWHDIGNLIGERPFAGFNLSCFSIKKKMESCWHDILLFQLAQVSNKTKESYWHDIFLFQLAKESAVFNFRNGQISKKGSKFRDSSILNFPF